MKAMYRIKKNEDFAFTVKHGTVKKNFSYVTHTKTNDLGFVRVGISVSSKLGCAVVRNRIKRQIRAMVRELVEFTTGSRDIVIVAKSDFKNHSFEENKKLLAQLIA